MNEPLRITLAILFAYGIGSIPFGLLLARIVKGVDIRTMGSGNIGATNVARSIGWAWGIVVLLLDALKGWLPTRFLPLLAVEETDPRLIHIQVACGVVAVLGHMFPVWLGMRGGKGVATALGVILVLAPQASLVAAVVFILTFALTRIVALGSILASIAFAGYVFWQLWPLPFSTESWSLAAFSLAIPLLIIVRHRTNITRLLRGEEKRFQRKVVEEANIEEPEQEAKTQE